ncbi:MAG: hypothetical protein M3288_01170, partial [Thermoproteota archaeon]|nr:hypothetical protein [Thermoproteota archaeon]
MSSTICEAIAILKVVQLSTSCFVFIIKGLVCAAHNRGLGWRRRLALSPFAFVTVIYHSYKGCG